MLGQTKELFKGMVFVLAAGARVVTLW